ncbi:NAD(P)H-dependent oxidoreductase [Flavihumibacter rivuli]|uniref:NAD(P)H-dependent oxidoreductase n=1 Tax=Flavihumibacter rivuli TaxID=2838156 RepID=UPI001BDEB6EE|nr:NAD(P)H-dependent oxidoreductase [Flavihumibacter rivuli]ULQ57540.1 NAD(P)H-dependent oxidoreductase [Flavihumibacter rivuli]
MARILIQFAHPALEKSRVHKQLLRHIPQHPDIYVNDLYERYPDFNIDITREQQLLLKYDIIVLQHPFYWYSSPAIIKQWQDLVLEHGWAYGSQGNALKGKVLLNAISAGGSFEVYRPEGRNRHTIPEFLYPFEQTARLCHMEYWPPFAIHGTHRLQEADISLYALQYEQLLLAMANDRVSPSELATCHYLNDLVPIPSTIQS